jgi:hypothetical protein
MEQLALRRFKEWLKAVEEGDAIYDGSKPTTFNWAGAVGLPQGKVIDGDIPVKKDKKSEHKPKRSKK